MIIVNGTAIGIRRGDTGSFAIHVTGRDFGANDRALFTIKDENRRTIVRELLPIVSGNVEVSIGYEQSRKFRLGDYFWDVRFIVDPVYEDGELAGGTVIDTPMTEMRFSVGRTVGEIEPGR